MVGLSDQNCFKLLFHLLQPGKFQNRWVAMYEWSTYFHFLLSQITVARSAWLFDSEKNKLAPTKPLQSPLGVSSSDTIRPRTREYINLYTRRENNEDNESDDSWGFQDTSLRTDTDGIVEVTGSRYLLSGCKLPWLLPWASETLDVDVPRLPRVVSPRPVFSERHCVNEDFLADLRGPGLFHESQIKTDEKHRRRHGHGHTQDEMYLLKYGPGLGRVPDVVLYPENESQVIYTVEAASRHNVCIIPFGGGTNVTEALKCSSEELESRMFVSLDTRRMNKIIWIDPVNRLAQIEAGAVGRDIIAVLAKRGFTIGHEPDSCEFSTLGGWIATNASGMKKNRYGNIEDVVLDMRVVTPSAPILTKSPDGEESNVHPRTSVGSDPLRYLFGSEGTLGIIASAVVKLHLLPECMEYAAVLFPTWEHGVQFLYEVRQTNCQPASVRLMDNEQFRMSQALKPAPPSRLSAILTSLKRSLEHFYILKVKRFDPRRMAACTLVFEGPRSETRSQQNAVNHLVSKYSGVNAGAENGRRGYEMTYNIAYIRDFAMQHYILAESFETSISWSQVLHLCSRVKARIHEEHKIRHLPGKPLVSCRVTQLYETGVAVYFYFAYYYEGVLEPSKVYKEIEDAAREEIMLAGGSLSHHHGVGKLRTKFLDKAWSNTALEWRRDIKRAIDPNNIFGCGNLSN